MLDRPIEQTNAFPPKQVGLFGSCLDQLLVGLSLVGGQTIERAIERHTPNQASMNFVGQTGELVSPTTNRKPLALDRASLLAF